MMNLAGGKNWRRTVMRRAGPCSGTRRLLSFFIAPIPGNLNVLAKRGPVMAALLSTDDCLFKSQPLCLERGLSHDPVRLGKEETGFASMDWHMQRLASQRRRTVWPGEPSVRGTGYSSLGKSYEAIIPHPESITQSPRTRTAQPGSSEVVGNPHVGADSGHDPQCTTTHAVFVLNAWWEGVEVVALRLHPQRFQ